MLMLIYLKALALRDPLAGDLWAIIFFYMEERVEF